jgi:hypothetical protein
MVGRVDPLKVVSAAVTWVAGLVAYFYVVGGLLMWIRLHEEGLPPMPILSELPKQLLVSIALIGAVAPAILFIAIALSAIALQTHVVPQFNVATAQRRPVVFSGSVLAGLAFVVVLALLVGRHSNSTLAWGFAVAGVITYLLAMFTAAALGKAPFKKLQTYVLVAVVAGLAGASMRIYVDFRRNTLPDALVCLNDTAKGSYRGVLVARSDSMVYLGDTVNHRLVVIPNARVGALQVGGTSAADCNVPDPLPK